MSANPNHPPNASRPARASVASARSVPVAVLLALLAAALPATSAADEPAAQPASHLVPADKGCSAEQLAALRTRGTQRVYAGAARTAIGMPCGGLCAGQLFVRGDGTLASWEIDGRTYFGGVGHTSYDTYRPRQPIAQGFALAVRDADGQVSRATLDDAGYDAIEFVGEYPRARVCYRAAGAARAVPPVSVDLEVFSPFIPLDARASAFPATVLHFTVTNPTAQPLTVALGGWLENMACGERTNDLTIKRRNQAIVGDGLTTVLMDVVEGSPPMPAGPAKTKVIADFEVGTYDGWTVTGEAFGQEPARGTLPNQQEVSGFGGARLVNTFHGGDPTTGRLVSTPLKIDLPYLTFRIGGGRHPDAACLNLVVGDRVVRSATGRDNEKLEPRVWDVSMFAGQMARIEIVDTATGAWGHINVDDIVLTNALGPEYREYDEAALGFGNLALTLLGDGQTTLHWTDQNAFLASLLGREVRSVSGSQLEPGGGQPLVGAVTSQLTLAPGATQNVTFIVSWYFPNLHTGHGRMYTNWFGDARDVARQLAADLPRLQAETRRFCDSYYRGTTLPWWLASRLMMPVANLATGTAQWWQNGRFWAWEGAYCCSGTCTHVWNYAQGEAWLFPELARSARTMQDLGAGFEETSGLVGFRSDRNFAADGQAGTILKCYREHLTSADDVFLRKHWTRIKAALEYLISEDGDDNGLLESDRQHNTYDINFVGPNTFVGSLYLAALRAGEEMARHVGDTPAAERYRALFERGRDWTAKHLFNGEYYEQRVPPGDTRDWQYGTGCLSDQVFGQNWAHVLDLGYIYPPEQVRSALTAAYKYNWAPDVGPLNAVYPPERVFARPGEPGLFICTWPRGGRPKEPVRYRDEVWTGIEYQLAAGLVWEGFVDEGLLIVHGVEQRYDGAKHNPWNEVECGDHYARALASWGVLHALAGFTFDGPAGRLGIAPRFQPDDFACFFAAGTGWGNLAQRRTDAGQSNQIELRWGTLRLKRFDLEVPADAAAKEVVVTLRGDEAGTPQTVPAKLACDAARCVVELDQPVELQAGQQLRIELRRQ